MKIAKKLLAVVMALAMIAALTAVAFAASVSVSEPAADGSVSVKLVDAVGLKSGKLYFAYDKGKITKITKKNGADVKNIGDVDNAYSNEFNSSVNPAEYGFYFKENLWDSATWAAADGADAAVNGENFEAAVFTFTGEPGTTVTVTGDLVIGDTKVPVNASFTLPKADCAHEWDAGKVTKEATCTEAGVKTFTCTKCGETKTEAIAAAGHKFDAGKVTKEATCTAEGVKTFTCTVCGATKTESIAKIAHSYGSDGKCTVCGAAKPVAPSKPEKEYDIEPNNNGIPYVCPCGNKDCKCTNKDCKCDGKTAASKCTDAKCACNAKAADKPTEKAAANNGTKTTPKTDGGKNTGDNSVLAIMAGVIALAGAAYVATKKRK